MLVKFILRVPGQHQQIGKAPMDAVPRQGDTVTMNDITRTVRSVDWNLTEMSVFVLLDE